MQNIREKKLKINYLSFDFKKLVKEQQINSKRVEQNNKV